MYRTLLTLYALFVSVSFTVAQPTHFSFNQGTIEPVHGYYQELPLELIGGCAYVSVVVGGKPRRFLVDTGAVTVVTPRLQQELGFPVSPDSVALHDVNETVQTKPVVTLTRLLLGDLIVRNTPTVVMDMGLMNFCPKADGILGSNLFRNSILAFDAKRRKLVVTDDLTKVMANIPFDPATYSRIEFPDAQSTPYIELVLDGVRVQAMFDSGDRHFVSLPRTVWEQHRPLFKGTAVVDTTTGVSGMGLYGFEPIQTKYRVKFYRMQFANRTLSDVVVTTDASATPRVGFALLTYGSIIVDYKHGRFYLAARRKQLRGNHKPDFGLSPALAAGKLILGMVWKNSPVAEAGLQPGDQLLAINGLNTDDQLWENGCTLYNNDPNYGDRLTLVVKDKAGQTRTVTLRKKVF